MSENEKNIEQTLKELIADRLSVDISEVTPEKEFGNDLGADSLDTVELIMECEKTYNIKIEDTDAEKFKTVGAVLDYLKLHVK